MADYPNFGELPVYRQLPVQVDAHQTELTENEWAHLESRKEEGLKEWVSSMTVSQFRELDDRVKKEFARLQYLTHALGAARKAMRKAVNA